MKTRSELKSEYKQHKADMGVFQIVNKNNGKRLIDSSLDMNSKWNRHKTELNFGAHKIPDFQKDWKELGKDSFSFKVISQLEYNEDSHVNYSKELKMLHELVLEEIRAEQNSLY